MKSFRKKWNNFPFKKPITDRRGKMRKQWEKNWEK